MLPLFGGVNWLFVDNFESVVGDSPFGESFRVFGWDVLVYYYNLIFHLFADYSWVVRVSYAVVVVSCITLVGLLFSMVFDIIKRNRMSGTYNKIKEKYYDKLIDVCRADVEELSEEDLRLRLDYRDRRWKDWELSIWANVFVEVSIASNASGIYSANMQLAAKLVGLYDYLKKMLKSGSEWEKRHFLEMLMLTGIQLPSSTVTSLLNDGNRNLRKSSRIFYMLTSNNSPTFFLEEEDSAMEDFSNWDMMEVHDVFNRLDRAGCTLPTLVPVVKNLKTTDSGCNFGAFMMNEIAYWNTDKEMKYLFRYFNSSNLTYRKAAFVSMGLRQFEEAEDAMKAVFYKQPDVLQRTILEAIFSIKSGRSISFFVEAFSRSVSVATRLKALSCLFLYGEEGYLTFLDLKAQADDTTGKLFAQVEDPLINNYNL